MNLTLDVSDGSSGLLICATPTRKPCVRRVFLFSLMTAKFNY
jgi:hypothetical protein